MSGKCWRSWAQNCWQPVRTLAWSKTKDNKITRALYTIADFSTNYQLSIIMLSTEDDVDQPLTVYTEWMAPFVAFHTYLQGKPTVNKILVTHSRCKYPGWTVSYAQLMNRFISWPSPNINWPLAHQIITYSQQFPNWSNLWGWGKVIKFNRLEFKHQNQYWINLKDFFTIEHWEWLTHSTFNNSSSLVDCQRKDLGGSLGYNISS